MFSVCFYWYISCCVIISYLLTAVFDARLKHLIKSVIHSFIYYVFSVQERLTGIKCSSDTSDDVKITKPGVIKGISISACLHIPVIFA